MRGPEADLAITARHPGQDPGATENRTWMTSPNRWWVTQSKALKWIVCEVVLRRVWPKTLQGGVLTISLSMTRDFARQSKLAQISLQAFGRQKVNIGVLFG